MLAVWGDGPPESDMPKLNKSYPFNDIDCVNKVNEMARIPKDSWLFLFKYITKNKEVERLKEGSVLSYTTLRELFKAKVRQLGYSADKFGLQSLKAGGATSGLTVQKAWEMEVRKCQRWLCGRATHLCL